MKGLLAVLAGSLFILAACGGGQPVGAASGGTVSLTVTEWGVALSQPSVPSGKVTFTVKNAGALTHEVVVIKTDLAADKIQVDPSDTTKMSEDGSQGESGDIEAGQSATFTLILAPGHYVLMCNQPSHYVMGMHIPFTVN